MSDLFAEWAAGTLARLAAPEDAVNLDTLWAWGHAESGPDLMRWCNPLNTTQELLAGQDVDPDMNSVGVEAYASVQDGCIATAATLLNGRYPTIVSHLRNSVPRSQWADACAELGTWGTGCGWLNADYGAYSGALGEDMTPDEHTALFAIRDALLGNPPAAGVAYLGYFQQLIPQVQNLVDKAEAAEAAGQSALTPEQAQILIEIRDALVRLETALKAA